MLPKIVILGSGNVATHLAHAFENAGAHIAQVYSRNYDNASQLASTLQHTQAIDDLSSLILDADLYLIAVSDAAVSKVAESMPQINGIVAHTSGSIPLNVLANVSLRAAVLYPLQTFTKTAKVKIDEVPFFTEASDALTQDKIDEYALLLSDRVYHADSQRRKTLHVAGVLSCNFVNYLWDCTSQVLASDNYDFSVVEPLVRATLEKAVAMGPHASQTGPAMRCDVDVMKEHMLRLDSDTANLYKELSNQIMKSHQIDCKI